MKVRKLVIVGGVAGGVIGGAAGNLLSPDQEKVVRELVRNVCRSLPNRR
jgi:gas vesicle protein